MQRNSRHQHGARIKTVNAVDLGLRASQLYGDGDSKFYVVPMRRRNGVGRINYLGEERVGGKAKINME